MPLRRPARPGFLRPPIGRRLAELRLAAGLTQKDVARALGVAQTFIARVECGTKPVPPARLASWAALLAGDQAELESLR